MSLVKKIGHEEGGANGTISLKRRQWCLISDKQSISIVPST
jgi:hypothetical protein